VTAARRAPSRARGDHQPRRQGRQGWSSLQLHRAGRGGRRRRHRSGVGYGKAKEVPAAIAKGVEEAKKHFFKVPRIQGTIPHPVQGERAAASSCCARRPRYRRHRRWPGARRAGVRRHPRRAEQVARLGQRHQHRPRHRGRAAGLERPEAVARPCGLPLGPSPRPSLLRAQAAGRVTDMGG
jgi:small subunit ribosomal protein S5